MEIILSLPQHRTDLSLLNISEEEWIAELPNKIVPQWKRDLLIQASRYARDNYENGLDTMYECYSVAEVLKIVRSAYTWATWEKRINEYFGIINEHAAEIAASAF